MDDLISVIVPVYNVEAYIRECIESLLCQTYRKFELIIVDDGSTDSCGLICDEYKKNDNRVTVIHKKNGGLSDARNTGLDIMNGSYVTFVDSDDVVSNIYLEELYKASVQYNADIVQCGMIRDIKGLNDTIQNSPQILHNSEILKSYLRFQGPKVMACGKLYKKGLFNELRFPCGIVDEDDFTTYVTMYQANTYVGIGQNLYFYRRNCNSITYRKFTKERFNIIKSADSIRGFLKGRTTEFDSDVTYYELRMTVQLYHQAIEADAAEEYKEQFDKLFHKIYQIDATGIRLDKKYRLILFMIRYCNGIYRTIIKNYRHGLKA